MAQQYPLSMSPIQIGKLTIKNRYCSGAVTGRFLLYEQTGAYSPNGMEFEVSHARGGFGLIVTGSNYGDQTVDPFNPMADKPSPLYMPKVSGNTFRQVTERVHQYGSRIFLQVAFGPGRMRNGKAPSVLPTLKDPAKYTTALTAEEIERLLTEAARLAKYGKDNGFDGVEIHAHFGYLLDQFEMQCTNHRTDEYGGDLDGRLTVYRKLIRYIKESCGEDFPVAIRMGLKTFMKSFTEASLDGSEEFGRDVDETIEVAKKLEEYGIDMFDFNSGTYESHYYCTSPYYMPMGYNIEMAAKVKKAVHVPVFVVGLMDDVEMCERALERGDIDGITICRAAMVDTQYARKVAEGRTEEIRPCIHCSSCEHWNLKNGVPLCSANPAAMREWSYGVPKTNEPKKVAVIGGGIAGLVAAHTAARAGHRVCLYEAASAPGGHMRAIGQQDGKAGIKKLNLWYQNELKKLGVELNCGKAMSAEEIKKTDAQVVILATGSRYGKAAFPVEEGSTILQAPAILAGACVPGEHVSVIGGGCAGSEIAFTLAKLGKKVTVIEKDDTILGDRLLSDDVSHMLRDLLTYWNVEVKSSAEAIGVTKAGVSVRQGDAESVVPADAVILATGVEPVPSLYDELCGCGKEIYAIGDCTGARNTILTASHQAYEIARGL